MGTYIGNPKLKFLSKSPDSGYEQGYHTIKCLGSNSEKQKLFFSSHLSEPGFPLLATQSISTGAEQEAGVKQHLATDSTI